MSVEIHELEEIKAKVSLEIANFRRELDLLKKEKDSYLEDRQKEALIMVDETIKASTGLLVEAKSTANSVDSYLKSLKSIATTINDSRNEFATYVENEQARLLDIKNDAVNKLVEIKELKLKISNEKVFVKNKIKEIKLLTVQANKDLNKAQNERMKLMNNLNDVYGRKKR